MSVYIHALFMGLYVSVCILEGEGEQPASSQGALVLVYVYMCPQRLEKVLPHGCFLSDDMFSESSQRLSEGFGTGGVGDGVGHRLLWVAAVVVNLEQDGEVHQDLQQPTRPELHRSLGEQEVARFKGVTAGPHQNHLDTVGKGGIMIKGEV